MSLNDLKKKGPKKPKPKLSVEEFIDDATAYAKGKSVIDGNSAPKNTRCRNYKNATFTLAPTNIEHLNQLAESTGLAKSRLIRLMIEQAMDEALKALSPPAELDNPSTTDSKPKS